MTATLRAIEPRAGYGPDVAAVFARDVADIVHIPGADRWWPVARGGILPDHPGRWGYVLEGEQYARMARSGELREVHAYRAGVLSDGQEVPRVQIDAILQATGGSGILVEIKCCRTMTLSQVERQAAAIKNNLDEFVPELHWIVGEGAELGFRLDAEALAKERYGVTMRWFNRSGGELL